MNSLKWQNTREFLKEEFTKILKVFLLLYLAIFLILEIGLILQRNNIKSQIETLAENSNNSTFLVNKQDSIFIPKIAIEAPIIFVNSTKPEDFREPLKKGVTHFPSALPGEKGRVIILGHSAPFGWPKINYDWVFSHLHQLEVDDEVFIFFKNQEYRYLVKEKIFLKKGQDLPLSLNNNSPELFLISCWPPGIDNKRLAIRAEFSN